MKKYKINDVKIKRMKGLDPFSMLTHSIVSGFIGKR